MNLHVGNYPIWLARELVDQMEEFIWRLILSNLLLSRACSMTKFTNIVPVMKHVIVRPLSAANFIISASSL